MIMNWSCCIKLISAVARFLLNGLKYEDQYTDHVSFYGLCSRIFPTAGFWRTEFL
jgi:hypothetical protein